MMIEDNLTQILKTLPNDVKLVAVTKHRSVEEIQRVVDYGVQDLGENRVQELMDKYPQINGNVRWHLIGHLQRNKVKYIVDKVSLIHSVDSLRLAIEIDQQSNKIGKNTDILIQCNISKEESKHGLFINELNDFLIQASKLKNIKIKGLMTMAPYTDNIEVTREIFRKLNQIYDKIKANQSQYDNVYMNYLSMGMTNDYKLAVEEGSNIVRIGTGIFKK